MENKKMKTIAETVKMFTESHNYGEIGELFVGTFLRSLGGIWLERQIPWAHEVFNDYKGFDVSINKTFGHTGREYLKELSLKNKDTWKLEKEDFPAPEKMNKPEASCLAITLYLDKTIIVFYGLERDPGTLQIKPYISFGTKDDFPEDHYCNVDPIESVLDKEGDQEYILKSFKRWFPYMASKFITLMAEDQIRQSTRTMNIATLQSFSMMFSSNYQSTIQKYLVTHVYNEERGLNSETIQKDGGVPIMMLQLNKFEAIDVDIHVKEGKLWIEDGKIMAEGIEIIDVTMCVVGRNDEGTPEYMFKFNFIYHMDTDKTSHRVAALGFEVYDIDNVKHQLDEIEIEGTLIPEILSVFFNTEKEIMLTGLDMIVNYHKQLDSYNGNIHMRGDNHYAKITEYQHG